MNTLLEHVDVDYNGFHGPVCSAFVTDAATPFHWLESVAMIGYYCEDEEHEENKCECVTEDTLRAAYLDNVTSRGLWLVDEEGRKL